jgi:predicted glycosyltransferase involved in capsule biosynthesis
MMQLEVMSQGPCIKSGGMFLQMLIIFLPSLIHTNINTHIWLFSLNVYFLMKSKVQSKISLHLCSEGCCYLYDCIIMAVPSRPSWHVCGY